MVGTTATNVDTINELIQSDHQYHKEEPKGLSLHCPLTHSASSDLTVMSTSTSSLLSHLPTQRTVPAAHSLLSTSTTLCSSSSAVVRGRVVKPSATLSPSTAGQLSVVTMVDPNMVYTPRPRQPVDATVPDDTDSDFMSPDMMESCLDGLLSLEDLPDFSILDQKPQQQQTVITSSSLPSSAEMKHSVSSTRSSPTSTTVMCSSPTATVRNVTPSTTALEVKSLPNSDDQDEQHSADSGFSSDGSYLSDSSPSPVSLASSDMDSLHWQEDFVSVGMDLFPDVGLCV